LVFDIWGDYAHFRRFYTTTSPLTFPIPPRTALCGLIAAIIGKEKEYNEYLKYFTLNEASIGLRVLNPVKKVMIAENLIDTEKSPKSFYNIKRTRIRFEFLKDQKYRIYFNHVDEDIYQELKENLIRHKSVYTPCLGLSENIANFEFIGEFKAKSETTGGYVQINSVLPTEKIAEKQGINFNLEGEYFSIRVPIELNLDRVVTKYSDIFFERTGKPVEAKLISPYWRIDYTDGTNENFLFIE
jgi:CRISPR-associated protein Cas5h